MGEGFERGRERRRQTETDRLTDRQTDRRATVSDRRALLHSVGGAVPLLATRNIPSEFIKEDKSAGLGAASRTEIFNVTTPTENAAFSHEWVRV